MSDDPSAELQQIREKRITVLVGTWKLLSARKWIDPSRFNLSKVLLNEVVEHYLADWTILRHRYKITSNIQLHKVAGLMVASIIRYRPIQFQGDKYDSPNEIYANEIFAIYQGLAICINGDASATKEIMANPAIEAWIKDFCYLLHHRNHTAESLIFIFETFCCFWLPDNLKKIED